jgi:hypothetical protein
MPSSIAPSSVSICSPALPGSAHDLTAAREHGIIDALIDKGVMTFADNGYQDAGGTVRAPHERQIRGRRCRTISRPSTDPGQWSWKALRRSCSREGTGDERQSSLAAFADDPGG